MGSERKVEVLVSTGHERVQKGLRFPHALAAGTGNDGNKEYLNRTYLALGWVGDSSNHTV